MTKTEAADIMGLDIRVFARKADRAIDLSLAEERVSEYRGLNYANTYKGEAARLTTPRAALREAKRGPV